MIDLNAVVDHLAEGLQVVDRSYTYVYVNRVASEHGQTTREALLGRTMQQVYPGIEETEMFARLRRVMEDRVPDRMENEFVFEDSSSRWFELRMAPVPVGAAILSVDITDKKSLARQVARAQQMEAIGQLAGGFAHDFNNLLTVIQTCGMLLGEGLAEALAEDDPMLEDAAQIVDAAKRGAQLTRSLLALARRVPVRPRPVSIPDALDSLAGLLRRTIGSDITLTVDSDRAMGTVVIDPSFLDQVLLNLAINARDAMPNGGSLVIEAERVTLDDGWTLRRGGQLEPGRYLVASVSDTGSGIAPSEVDRIFEPFYTTKEDGVGTGLGLATSCGLIRQAGGVITVYSELDVGTTFRIYLPEVEGEPSAAACDERHAEVAIEGRRVLVVEDRDEIRALISRVLRRHQCRVLEASSGAEALLLLEDVGDALDLLVADVVMPRMSGFELADRVRGRLPSLPILLVTGYAPGSLATRGASSMELPLLSKPFTEAQLIDAVCDVLAAVGGEQRSPRS